MTSLYGLHIRLNITKAQRDAIFAAAELEGRSVTQWCRFNLMKVVKARKASAPRSTMKEEVN